MKTLISSTEGLLFVILLMVAFSLWLQRYKVFRSLGPVLTVVIIGIVLSNTHVVPISHDLYSSISTYCVQAGISICLLSMNVLLYYRKPYRLCRHIHNGRPNRHVSQ